MSAHVRINRGILAVSEKRLLVRIAERMPRAVTSDHLTALAAVAMALTGLGFAASRWDVRALWLVIPGLALNWFGDSLDGTVARVRKAERPRYGFYLDHAIDLLSATLLFGGLACSPFMSPVVALALLSAYLLVSGEVFLTTAVRGVFQMSFAGIGPTELRVLLAIGTVALFRDPHVMLPGLGAVRLFDLAGAIGAAGLLVTAILSAMRNASALAEAEPPIQ